MAKTFKHVDATEMRLIALWRKRGLSLPYIAELLDRDKGTVSRHIVKQNKVIKKKGQPPKVSDKTVDKLLTICDRLIEKADCRWAVTVKMLRIAGRVEACDRTILNAFHARRKIYKKATVPVQCPYSARTVPVQCP